MFFLLQALKARFESNDASALRILVGNRYYLGPAPEGTKHPSIEVITPGGNTTDETIACGTVNGARHETVNIDFVVHSDQTSPTEAWTIARLIQLLYDGQILTMSGSLNMVDVKRQGEGTAVRSFGDAAWSIVITYQYKYA